MYIRHEVLPYWGIVLVAGLLVSALVRRKRRTWRFSLACGLLPAAVLAFYFGWFFRDPDRAPPGDPSAVLAAADGRVAQVVQLDEERFRTAAAFSGLNEEQVARFLSGGKVLRVSIFLSLFDVHVNRAPIAGDSIFLGYFPGRHIFTFKDKSSDYNQHNSILFMGGETWCLVNQIVGPIARRVVYWPDHNRPVPLMAGDRIGMMKFGSRLDMYFPADEVTLLSSVGDRVRAGETVMARINKGTLH
ncbi:MAG: hypothetical protein FJ224_11335 [Lentisphaerae bacterium]|nr:hypothetical protein [Lentisphaerota bacterium]